MKALDPRFACRDRIVGQTFQPAGWPDSFHSCCVLSWEGEAPAEPLWIIIALPPIGSARASPSRISSQPRFARGSVPLLASFSRASRLDVLVYAEEVPGIILFLDRRET